MASSKTWINLCTECGRRVEILNGDFEFSMNLHKQSHKSLEVVNRDLDQNQGKIENDSRFNMKHCNVCKEDIEIINNDLSFSFQQHVQKHKSDNIDSLSDHSATSSTKRRSRNKNKTKEKAQTKPVLTSILEGIFHPMPIGLKAHRGFISENSCSKATCNLCDISIEPILSVTEHLKTKLHEDNTIQVIKTLIPAELQCQMEFVSFYGSNLYCNLCGCKIDLCSNNLHETVVNIFAHNAGRVHLSKKSKKNDSSQSDKPLVVLKTLALMDPLVNENQNLIEYKMNPCYKCKVCDKAIAYSDNEKELLNNFKCHLNSPGHKKSICSGAASLLNKWNDLNVPGRENHSFVVAKQNIYCVACSCFIDTNLEKLLAHVSGNSAVYGRNQFESVSGILSTNPPIAQIGLPSSSTGENAQRIGEPKKQKSEPVPGGQLPSTSTKSTEKIVDVKAQLNELLKNNVTIKWNWKYLENDEESYKCKLCKKIKLYGNNIKLLEENIMSHITGKKHKKNLVKELNDILVQLSVPDIQINRKFLMRRDDRVCCTLCDCIICTIPTADDVSGFIQNLLLHLRGSGHGKKKTAVEVSSSKSDNAPENVKTRPQNVIKELFDKLPGSYLRDIELISISPIEGYLSCSLCNSLIHPRFLKEHLEDLQHVQGKVEARIFRQDLNTS